MFLTINETLNFLFFFSGRKDILISLPISMLLIWQETVFAYFSTCPEKKNNSNRFLQQLACKAGEDLGTLSTAPRPKKFLIKTWNHIGISISKIRVIKWIEWEYLKVESYASFLASTFTCDIWSDLECW